MIPIYRPWLGDEEVSAVERPLRSGWLTQGPEVARFEQQFADYVGASEAVALSNCTTALHLALLLAGVSAGDEVITVSHSFIATANCLSYVGATPVFVDVDRDTMNMDPALLEAAWTPRCRALLVVHQLGMPAHLERILPWAQSKGLAVIEDAACAIGSEIFWDGRWEKIGRPHGDFACFSFHPRKLLTTGDGGMLTCRQPANAERARRLRQHGMSLPAEARHGSTQVTFESYDEVGFNYRLTDLQACLGQEQLKRLPALIERRRQQVSWYEGRLAGLAQRQRASCRSNWQSLAWRVPDGLDQREIMQRLLNQGIASRRGVMCAHREPAWPAGSWRGGPLPVSEQLQDRTVLLPLYHELTEAEMEQVVQACSRS